MSAYDTRFDNYVQDVWEHVACDPNGLTAAREKHCSDLIVDGYTSGDRATRVADRISSYLQVSE